MKDLSQSKGRPPIKLRNDNTQALRITYSDTHYTEPFQHIKIDEASRQIALRYFNEKSLPLPVTCRGQHIGALSQMDHPGVLEMRLPSTFRTDIIKRTGRTITVSEQGGDVLAVVLLKDPNPQTMKKFADSLLLPPEKE